MTFDNGPEELPEMSDIRTATDIIPSEAVRSHMAARAAEMREHLPKTRPGVSAADASVGYKNTVVVCR